MSFNRYDRFYKRAEYLLKQNYNLTDDDLKSDQAESFCNAYAQLVQYANDSNKTLDTRAFENDELRANLNIYTKHYNGENGNKFILSNLQTQNSAFVQVLKF